MNITRRSAIERFTSRPFLLALVGAIGAYVGHRYHIPAETIAIYTAPLIAFIVGESYRDGKAVEGVTPESAPLVAHYTTTLGPMDAGTIEPKDG